MIIDKLWFKSSLGKSGENRYGSIFSLEYICFSGILAFRKLLGHCHQHTHTHLTPWWYQWKHPQQLTHFCGHQYNSRPNCSFMLILYIVFYNSIVHRCHVQNIIMCKYAGGSDCNTCTTGEKHVCGN